MTYRKPLKFLVLGFAFATLSLVSIFAATKA